MPHDGWPASPPWGVARGVSSRDAAAAPAPVARRQTPQHTLDYGVSRPASPGSVCTTALARHASPTVGGAAVKAASEKFESERFCADKRIITSCDGGCSYFCSSLLLETLRCGPSNCTFLMMRSLP